MKKLPKAPQVSRKPEISPESKDLDPLGRGRPDRSSRFAGAADASYAILHNRSVLRNDAVL